MRGVANHALDQVGLNRLRGVPGEVKRSTRPKVPSIQVC